MWERRPPVATLSAGATTSARMAGPNSGTRICRGLLAVSAPRRRLRVSTAPADLGRAGWRCWIGMGSAMADMSDSLWVGLSRSGGLAERAGELQIDVVEVGSARGDLERTQALGLDRGQSLRGGEVGQGQRHPGAA